MVRNRKEQQVPTGQTTLLRNDKKLMGAVAKRL